MESKQPILVGNLLCCLQWEVVKLALLGQTVPYSLVFYLAFALRPKLEQCLRSA